MKDGTVMRECMVMSRRIMIVILTVVDSCLLRRQSAKESANETGIELMIVLHNVEELASSAV